MVTWTQYVDMRSGLPPACSSLLASLTLFPPSETCTNPDCVRHALVLKKEQQRAVVVYTAGHGVQPAWSIHLSCRGMCILTVRLPMGLMYPMKVATLTTTTTSASTMGPEHITRRSQSTSKSGNTSLLKIRLLPCGLDRCSSGGMSYSSLFKVFCLKS
jgi:hypothetical protein